MAFKETKILKDNKAKTKTVIVTNDNQIFRQKSFNAKDKARQKEYI